MPDVRPVEGGEGHPVGRLDYGLGLAVQAELAVMAVTSPELLARHREDAAGAVSDEDGVHAGRDEHPAWTTVVRCVKNESGGAQSAQKVRAVLCATRRNPYSSTV